MIGLAIAAASVGLQAIGMFNASKEADAQAEMASKRAEQGKESLKMNYKNYIENSRRDYFNNMYDMSNQYASAYGQLRQQYNDRRDDFITSEGTNVYNMQGSYYNDMMNEIDNQYDYAITDLSSKQTNNMYRTELAYMNTSKSKHQEFVDNLKRVQLGMEATQMQIKQNRNNAITQGLFNIASTGVSQYYKGNLAPMGLSPKYEQLGSQSYSGVKYNANIGGR